MFLIVMLVGGLFISCSNDMRQTESRHSISVSVAQEKELATDAAELKQVAVDKLYWYYSATKKTGAFIHGETAFKPVKTSDNAAAVGLTGAELGKFSNGGWEFVFKAFFEAIEKSEFATAKPVYTTGAEFTLTDDLDLVLYLEEGTGMPGNGFKFTEGVTFYGANLADPTVARLYVYEGSTLIAGPIAPENQGALDNNGNLTFKSADSYDLSVGEHTVTFKITVPGEGETLVVVGSAPILINVGKGVTQTLSGPITADDAHAVVTVDGYATVYTVTFDVNGGSSLESNTMEIKTDATYTELPTPEKEGYTFIGWFTNPEAGTQVTAETITGLKESQTLYAHWGANRTVTLNAHGGKCSVESITVTDNMAYGTLPTPTRYGYAFGGWYTAETDGTRVTSQTVCTTAENHTLHAKWLKEIHIELHGAYGSAYDTITAYAGVPVELPTGQTADEYDFTGYWHIKGSNNKYAAGSSYSFDEDTDLYGEYTEKSKISITFKDYSGGKINVMTPYAGVGVQLPSDAPEDGNHKFKGYWCTGANGTGDQYEAGKSYSFSKDVTLYGWYDTLSQ